jgi:ABC-type transporter Mla MlaB component
MPQRRTRCRKKQHQAKKTNNKNNNNKTKSATLRIAADLSFGKNKLHQSAETKRGELVSHEPVIKIDNSSETLDRIDSDEEDIEQDFCGFPKLVVLNLSYCRTLIGEHIAHIPLVCPRLRELIMSGCWALSAEDLKPLFENINKHLSQTLVKLDLSQSGQVGLATVKLICANCVNLTSLNIHGSSSMKGPDVLTEISRNLKNLKELYVGDCNYLDDAAFASLGETDFIGLQVLDISGCPLLTVATINHLVTNVGCKTSLTTLKMGRCTKIEGNEAIRAIMRPVRRVSSNN